MISFFKRKKEIPEDVQRDLERAVEILKNSDAPIREVRLFGSLLNGKWRRYPEICHDRFLKTSDIDLGIITSNDERYSNFTIPRTFDKEGFPVTYSPTPERKKLVSLIRESSLLFKDRYDFHIGTPRDIKKYLKEKIYFPNISHQRALFFGKQNCKPFVKSLLNGKLLYSAN
ncbi:nucleotidyltransferase domain-containing protein [Candidatus Pacearchaeota archaeon]|nr:nucleotidyltransferase domain-containing protein [Candidatus Pacearchaeota archaeon]